MRHLMQNFRCKLYSENNNFKLFLDLDHVFVKTHFLIDLKGIIIQMHSSVVRCFAFHSKRGAAIFHRHRIQIKRQTNINMKFVYLSIKLVKYYPFLFVLNHLKLDF